MIPLGMYAMGKVVTETEEAVEMCFKIDLKKVETKEQFVKVY
jgi:hypothetical protein